MNHFNRVAHDFSLSRYEAITHSDNISMIFIRGSSIGACMLDTNHSWQYSRDSIELADAHSIETGGYPLAIDTGEPVGGT